MVNGMHSEVMPCGALLGTGSILEAFHSAETHFKSGSGTAHLRQCSGRAFHRPP